MNTSMRLTFAALLCLTLAPCMATAQGEKPAKPEAEAAPAPAQPKPPKPEPQPYKLMISVKESDSGKPSAEKNYTLAIIADDSHSSYESLRDGDNIPFKSEKGEENLSVGTNIDFSDATRQGETLIVKLSVSNSTLTEKSNGINLPQSHVWRIQIVAVLLPGKPTVVYSATDATTGHKVEIQATAQPLNAK
jgi:hypothetical protein